MSAGRLGWRPLSFQGPQILQAVQRVEHPFDTSREASGTNEALPLLLSSSWKRVISPGKLVGRIKRQIALIELAKLQP
jgi:hypothetical protein